MFKGFILLTFFCSLVASAVSAYAVNDPVFPFPASNTRVVSCNNCANDNDWGSAAITLFSRHEGGVVYEMDFINHVYKKEYVYLKPVQTGNQIIYVHRVKEVTNLVQQEVDGFNDLWQFHTGFMNYTATLGTLTVADNGVPMSHKNWRQRSVAVIAAVTRFFVPPAYASGSTTVGNEVQIDPSIAASAYDFILQSKARNQAYDAYANNSAVGAFLTHLNSAELKFNANVISVGGLRHTITFKFQDGSKVIVAPSSTTETMVVVPGSARDADGNTIPDTQSQVPGQYSYGSHAGAHAFEQFLINSYGPSYEFVWDSCPAVTMVTCITDSSGSTNCSAISCM